MKSKKNDGNVTFSSNVYGGIWSKRTGRRRGRGGL